MSENTKIEWADHTFNPWIGCTKVSPGCANCYAEAHDHRFGGGHWGKGAPRKRTSEANWRKPLQWNKAVAGCHTSPKRPVRDFCAFGWIPNRPRVFCASLADWLDDEVPIEWLADLLVLIHDTPNLDWLLLTKRPENWRARIDHAIPSMETHTTWAAAWLQGVIPLNVWIGTTVEDQTRADERIPALIQIPARVRFLSCEPLLGPVDLSGIVDIPWAGGESQGGRDYSPQLDFIHWVICGGESGPNARPMHPDWARSLRDQCAGARVPFLFKQWGEWLPESHLTRIENVRAVHAWPSRQFPVPETARRSFLVGKKAAGRQLDGREHNEFPG